MILEEVMNTFWSLIAQYERIRAAVLVKFPALANTMFRSLSTGEIVTVQYRG